MPHASSSSPSSETGRQSQSGALPQAVPAAPAGVVTKAFSLAREDAALIDQVRREENLLSDSAALRLLIRDGHKFRDLRRQAERELVARSLRDDAGSF